MNPLEPNADFRQGAFALRELYVAFVQAGFTETQAYDLTREALSASVRGAHDRNG